MKTAKDVLKSIKDNDVKYVDLRFTDPRGKWQHVTFDVSMIEEDTFAEGQMFDGSSIAGWKAINESDMCLMPDPVTATIDPFFAETTMVIICDVLEPTTGEPYNRDPRGIAKKAEAMVKSMGVGDTMFFGPEAEFFVFDDVRYQTTPYNTGFKLDSSELPINSDTEYEGGNLGHRIRTKGGYFPVPPQDSVQDMRSEMLGAMAKMGVKVEKHHHEVASAQHELGMKFDTMTLMADQMQIYKYCIHQVAHIYGKTATFMPKPVYGDNGSGMHCHQSIWKDGKPVFAGNKYADLSETCLHYIGGIIKHAKAINAFTNPSTNSYKRLVPGYEAPVLLAYSARNRSASCRIPYTANPKAKRVEVRFPDPMANPYLGFAAMLMAGLDGIKNKIDPGPAMDKDLYDLPKEELKQIPTVCGSLREALENLDKDRAFLKNGGVFDDDFIDSFIELKMTEVERFEMTPHPVEFDMYYSPAAPRTRSSFERPGCLLLISLNRRGNSPSCGVRTTCGSPLALIDSNSRLRPFRKTRQRVGVEYETAFRRQRGVDEITRAAADAGARPDHDRIEPLVVEQFGELDHGVDGANHDGCQRSRVDCKRIARRGHRDQSRPCPQRAARRQPRRPGRCQFAGEHDRVAAGVFVAVDVGHGEGFLPALRNVFRCPRADLVEHARIDADVGDAHAAAAVLPSRHQQMRRLAAEEGHGLRGVDRSPHYVARRAVDPARQVDGEHGRAVGIDRLDHLERIALDGTIEPGAEQRVDDQCRLADRLRVEWQHRDTSSRVRPAPRRPAGCRARTAG